MFTSYIESFLKLLDRFVTAYEVRNDLIEQQTGNGKTIKENATEQAQKEEAREEVTNDTGSRGTRSRSRAAGNTSPDPEPEASTDTGRRTRSRAGAGAETGNQEEASNDTGRRTRSRANKETKEPEKPKLTPEQADLAAAIEDMRVLSGDVDAAAADVKDFFKAEGWADVAAIPADDLEWAHGELNKIIDQYFD